MLNNVFTESQVVRDIWFSAEYISMTQFTQTVIFFNSSFKFISHLSNLQVNNMDYNFAKYIAVL